MEKEDRAVHKSDMEDLIVFRWLERQISKERAITACLLVLQGNACSEVLPAGDRTVAT